MTQDALGAVGTSESGVPSPPPGHSRKLSAGPIYDVIAGRAHRKWMEHGCRESTAVQDWLEAEAEVQAEIRRGLRY